jgi:hypothetical protein
MKTRTNHRPNTKDFIDTASPEFWACRRKQSFTSERIALRDTAACTHTTNELRVYKCQFCKNWHRTSKTKFN